MKTKGQGDTISVGLRIGGRKQSGERNTKRATSKTSTANRETKMREIQKATLRERECFV